MEEQGDTSFLKDLNCDQFMDYLVKRFDLVEIVEYVEN